MFFQRFMEKFFHEQKTDIERFVGMRENWELIELDEDEWDTLTQEEYDYLVQLLDNLSYDPDLANAGNVAVQGIKLEEWYENSTLCRNGL